MVQLLGNPVADAEVVADALANCAAADLFNFDGRAVWVREGELVQINGLVLRELAGTFVVTKTLVIRDGRAEVIYAPVVLDEQMVRAICGGPIARQLLPSPASAPTDTADPAACEVSFPEIQRQFEAELSKYHHEICELLKG